MRTAVLTAVMVAFAYAATAQFSLLPQVGFENSKTNLSYNNLSSFEPLGVKFSPQVGLRIDYKFKQGHGPWLGVSSSRASVNYSFTDPDNGMTVYSANAGDMQLRIEAGYQHSFKPIYFNQNSSGRSKSKQSATTSQLKQKTPLQTTTTTTVRRGCGGKEEVVVVRSICAEKTVIASRCGDKQKIAAKKDKGPWMRVQPSLGVGFIPSVPADFTTKAGVGQNTYEYKAGNWNTALIAGTGFEFGRNNHRLFTVTVSYFKGMGNLDEQTFTTMQGTKATTTTLQSESSGWGMKVGIPFTLKKQAKQRTEQKKKECDQYKMQYRSKCSQRIRI